MNCLIITIILGLIVFLLELWTNKKHRKLLPVISILFVVQFIVWGKSYTVLSDDIAYSIGFNIWAYIALGLAIFEFIKGKNKENQE